jgi:hypothetical protein
VTDTPDRGRSRSLGGNADGAARPVHSIFGDTEAVRDYLKAVERRSRDGVTKSYHLRVDLGSPSWWQRRPLYWRVGAIAFVWLLALVLVDRLIGF